jgi:hypothetical protein
MGLGDSLGPGTTDRSLRRSFPPTLSIQYVKEQTPNVFEAGEHFGPPARILAEEVERTKVVTTYK